MLNIDTFMIGKLADLAVQVVAALLALKISEWFKKKFAECTPVHLYTCILFSYFLK